MTADFNFYINRQGARGRQGEQGEQGFSPVITVNTDTAQEYKLNIETENDLIVTPNLKGNPLTAIPGAGKYVLFDETNNTIYNSGKPSELVDTTMFASTSDAGIIRIADATDITDKATDVAVTPKQLADAIDDASANYVTDVTNGSTANIINVVKDGVTAQITINNVNNAVNSTNAVNATNATNATNSTNATNAMNDGSGNNISNTYATKTELSVVENEIPDVSNFVEKTDYASSSEAGVIKVDNSTIVINSNGVISAIAQTPSIVDGGEEV